MNIDERTSEFLDPHESSIFEQYAAIIRRLRAPDGCPWDRKQTLTSLRRFIVEESFELLAAINDLDTGTIAYEHVAEELGDVFLVAMLIADALAMAGGPTLSHVLQENGGKLLRRHPHVFSDVDVASEHDVVVNWNQIKKDVENKHETPAAISSGLPPLERAYEIQKKAARLGFDWPHTDPVFDKVREETEELRAEIAAAEDSDTPVKDNRRIEAELGDLLFSVVNLSRKLKADPSVALAATNRRFLQRFRYIEEKVSEQNRVMADIPLQELDELWEDAKSRIG